MSEADVRRGGGPPREVVARELVERTETGGEVTAKRWPSDWYARRFESSQESESDGEPQLAREVSRSTGERVRELVRTEGITSVPSVLGRLQLSPEYAETVSEIVAECS